MCSSGAHTMKKFLIFIAIVSVMWIGFTLFLDFRYTKLPEVTLGGLKILLVGYVLLGLLLAGLLALRAVWRKVRG